MRSLARKIIWAIALGIVIGSFAGFVDAGIAVFSNPSLGRGRGLLLYFSRVAAYYALFWSLLAFFYCLLLLSVFRVPAIRNPRFSDLSGHIVSLGFVLQFYIDSVNRMNDRLSTATTPKIALSNALYLVLMALLYSAVYLLFRMIAVRFRKSAAAIFLKTAAGLIALVLGINLLSAVAEAPERLGAQPGRITLEERDKGPNIILIIIDSLRPDHLSCYGYHEAKTANIDGLAEQSLVFMNAMANAPWTYPSLASIFTSLYPDALSNCLLAPIPDQVPTLAQIVSGSGIKTAAIVSNPFINSSLGLTSGFTHKWNSYEPYFLPAFSSTNLNIFLARILRRVYQNEGAATITHRVIRWLSNNQNAPFFLWVHYIDPHHPYGKKWNDIISGKRFQEKPGAEANSLKPPGTKDGENSAPNAPDLRRIEYLYDQDLLYTDRYLGELFRFLRGNGLWEKSAIILTADHGEEFFERGHIGHNVNLDWGAIHVPLMIKMPGAGPSGLIREPVELVDLYPTILELLGIPSSVAIQGKSLLPMIRGGAAREDDFFYSSCNRFQSPQIGLRDSRYTLIYYPREKKFQLFDRVKDPWEQKDIAGAEPQVAQKMLAALRERRRANKNLYLKFYPEGKVRPEVRLDQRALRALGYVK